MTGEVCSKFRIVFGLSLVAIGCRDAVIETPIIPIDGYQIEGTVVDGLDQPFGDLPISLFYTTEFLDNNVPVRAYTIQTPGEFVNIDVYDADSVLVRNLYAGTPGDTAIYVPWDWRRNDSTLVGSGIYTVRVTVGGMLRHSYVDVVDGNVTAVTNASGGFTISDVNLPVGYFPAPFFNASGAFIGNYRIRDQVYLECSVGGVTYGYPVRVSKGVVTRIAMRVQ